MACRYLLQKTWRCRTDIAARYLKLLDDPLFDVEERWTCEDGKRQPFASGNDRHGLNVNGQFFAFQSCRLPFNRSRLVEEEWVRDLPSHAGRTRLAEPRDADADPQRAPYSCSAGDIQLRS